jgi:hypothetical protein
MSQTALERCDLPVPMHWPHAGSDLSRSGQRDRRAVCSLIRSKRLPRCLLYASNLASALIHRPLLSGLYPTLQLSAAIKSP